MKTLCLLLISWHTAAAATDPFAISSLPVTITNPGNYYVTRNLLLTETNCVAGILITTSNVTLDLKRFRLQREFPKDLSYPTSESYRQPAICAMAPSVVRNGSVNSWLKTGVIMSGGLLERLRISNCDTGMMVMNTVVRNCSMKQANTAAFGVSSRFESCTARGSGQDVGFFATDSAFLNCKAVGYYWSGFRLMNNCDLEECIAQRNVLDGIILVGTSNTVRRCVVAHNYGEGILADQSAWQSGIESNKISFNGSSLLQGSIIGGIELRGNEIVVVNNQFIRNKGYAIYDAGSSNVITNNIVRPRRN